MAASDSASQKRPHFPIPRPTSKPRRSAASRWSALSCRTHLAGLPPARGPAVQSAARGPRTAELAARAPCFCSQVRRTAYKRGEGAFCGGGSVTSWHGPGCPRRCLCENTNAANPGAGAERPYFLTLDLSDKGADLLRSLCEGSSVSGRWLLAVPGREHPILEISLPRLECGCAGLQTQCFYAFGPLEDYYSNAKIYTDKEILGLTVIRQNVNSVTNTLDLPVYCEFLPTRSLFGIQALTWSLNV